MKRFWKIFGITLASLLVVIVLVAGIAVYVVFTPARLTPIVRNVADKFVTAPHEVGEVELTFFSTFPEIGVRVGGLYIINPMEGAQSDTLVGAPEVVARVDAMQLLKENILIVHELSLKDAAANIFINEAGNTNIDGVFALSSDTTAEEDTTAFALPFDEMKISDITLKVRRATFVDKKDSIDAILNGVKLTADADGLEDIDLHLSADAVSASVGGEQYAKDVRLKLAAKNTALYLDTLGVDIDDADISINDFALNLKGKAQMGDDIKLDAHVEADKWDIPTLLQLLPQSLTSMLDGIDIDAATLSLSADVAGICNDSVMPIVDATVELQDAKAAYMEAFPYQLEDINLKADAHLDLNDKGKEQNSAVSIKKLHARTGKTEVDATGKVTELLGDMLADVSVKLNVNLPEFKRYLESDSVVTDLGGMANGTIHAKGRLSNVQKMRLAKCNVSGNINLSSLYLNYDTIEVTIPNSKLTLQVPNSKPTKKNLTLADVKWQMDKLTVTDTDLSADLGQSDLHLEVNDFLTNEEKIIANAEWSSQHINATMPFDTIDAALKKPIITGYVEYLTKEQSIPNLSVSIKFDDIKARYTTILAHMAASELSASAIGGIRDKKQPLLKAFVKTEALQAEVGDSLKVDTKEFRLYAQGYRDPSKENILLQWSPRLSVDLKEGNLSLAQFGEKIEIPRIRFDYSNRHCDIKESRIVIGNSDFELKGEVNNIGRWLEKKAILEGNLEFTSVHTDVNELLALTSADSGTEETPETVEPTETEANPFLVPKDVDLTLLTDIQEAVVSDQLARNLGGRIYVKDGVVVVEEMGFICNAAKLQLTAIYKTPRRNHIYIGLDYHMVDINIQELVNMVPQVDTLMPMLRSFRGNGEFHLAAETFTDAAYRLKWSTARGAMSIKGKDLVLLDGETFSQIAKILMFKKKTENKVDSIEATATLFKKEIDIYPFCLTMDKYLVAAGGRHNMDMSFDYHLSLLKPLYIGVDVKGTFDDLKIKPTKCKYAQDFRPIIRKDVETQNASLKKMIDASLRRNVKIE